LVANPDFNQLFAARGAPIELSVLSPNDMTVENVEITVEISGGTTEFLENVRMVLVSPSGTHSELNHYFVSDDFQEMDNFHQVEFTPTLNSNGRDGATLNPVDYIDPPSVDTNPGSDLRFTFSTNRIWGERSDDAIIFDPTTGEPVNDTFFGIGGNRTNAVTATAGTFLTQGWQLHMENYSSTNLNLDDFEVAWHGSPIDPGTERVQGFIGIDENRDDLFNYSRVIQSTTNLLGDDPGLLRLGEVVNIIDPNQESMAANITVLAHRDTNANGILDAPDILVDQFVTGHDGNYYFDLAPDNYIFSLDQASLGSFTTLDDSLTAPGFLQDYQSEWVVNADFFQVWDYDANLEVAIDPTTNAPLALPDLTGSTVQYGIKNINFLLDPGAPAAQQVEFSGTVMADFNGDGAFNDRDTVVPGVNVFADVNRNGQFDAGEILTETDANGQYNLVAPIAATTVLNVGVIAPVDWTPIDPALGLSTFFAEIGDVFNDVDFSIMPPDFSSGDGSNQTGFLFGTVFDDVNEDTLRQASEQGLATVTVFIDANNSGALEAGELTSTTNANGAFVFGNIAPGNYNLRVDLSGNPELAQTSPVFNSPRNVTISGAGTVANLEFGVHNNAVLDFGDLPMAYGITTLAEDGARHAKGAYFLGARIDTELDGAPSTNADSDDLTLDDDEDGITFITPINSGAQTPGATATIEAVASRYGGNLNAWIDFNADGDFTDPGEQILSNHALAVGTNVITFSLPATIAASGVYARFRYGEFGLGLTGPALIGEVEDYEVPVTSPVVASINADFDGDGQVSGYDLIAWQRGFGATSGAGPGDGDSNGDGQVDSVDLANWIGDYGTSTAVAATAVAPQTGDFNLDGKADGADFLAWQRGFGTQTNATLDQGDGNHDGNVDANDLLLWQGIYGQLGADVGTTDLNPVATAALKYESPSTASPEIVEASPSRVQNIGAAGPNNAPGSSRIIAMAALARPFGATGGQFASSLSVADFEARYENQLVETALSNGKQLAELGLAQRDRALDHLFAHKTLEQLQEESEGEILAEEALEFALAEEIDWRI
ncbi:MAG: GEVED domain-containing protein, partial [Pirellulales bacterium]|nr:GEVED domain-containing protein [Pirellulales bacterium]